ncbi:3-hydroxy-5-methyl-1-naphthoate 3-O-methyltransferase [Aquicella siphonis]|uniref:3-hydroxy-5-methyl-1-naphthoate 3-O-methyltransferase n=1 Tax=Aquicella siphonis TaxID=254247 RepID=A0A5E4PHN6_9COXI|nr:methyltransferase [Aquicella siphonis]VVC75836.1 3-hydroxy-5-methyl-1-naphthoate 3-O-methyltransferase [Aquicella siphonis]
MKMPLQLEKMMFGFVESQVLFVSRQIGLFDYLAEKDGSTVRQASLDLNLPQSSLERLLICALCIGLLKKEDERFFLSPEFSSFLSRQGRHYCGDRFSHYWKTTYPIFQHLIDALHEDKPQWNKLAGQVSHSMDPRSVYVNAIYSDERSTREFLDTMWASGYPDSRDLCARYPFAEYKRMVDLGGATGSFAIAALQCNPLLETVIMDFPNIKPYAENQFRLYNLAQRAEFHAGDMFVDILPEGDIYVLGYILSDWEDSVSLSLIRKVYDSLPENGLIIILEKLFEEDKSGPYLTAMLNLTMLLEMYGTLRSAADYHDWLRQTGFSDIKTIRSAGEKHMIVGKKISGA